MLSRVADCLYWMSRYLERAEHTARVIDVDLQLGLDQSPQNSSERWQRLFEALQLPELPIDTPNAASVTKALALGRSNPSSIFCCVAAARDNLRQVREQCSSEMWETLNRLYLLPSKSPKRKLPALPPTNSFNPCRKPDIFFRASPIPP